MIIFPAKVKLKTLTPHAILDLILILGLLVCSGFILHLNDEIKTHRESSAVLSKAVKDTHAVKPIDKDTLTILQPVSGAMVYFNKIDIEGEAEEGRIVTLSVNNKLVDVTLPKKGHFSFKGVKAKRGNNIITVKSITEGGEVLTLERMEVYYSSPSIRYLSRNVTRGSLEEKKIALTFDGGSNDNATTEILDILREESIQCTMFLTGTFIEKYPDLVQRMAAEGHEIGNHTFNHPHLTTFLINSQQQTLEGVTREFVQSELKRTEDIFRRITGKNMAPFWRAPYGEHNAEIRRWAAEIGYQQVGWTVGRSWENNMDSMDWVADPDVPNYHSAEEIKNKILSFGADSEHGANGCIVLMHLGTDRDDDFPHKKLPEIIAGYREKGYQWVKVSELPK